jgi:hypothetical protein
MNALTSLIAINSRSKAALPQAIRDGKADFSERRN